MAERTLDIKFDEKKLRRIAKQFSRWPKAMPKIMKESINSTASKARTRVKKRIGELLKGVRKKDIHRRIDLRKATLTRWAATITFTSKGFPLSKLGVRKGRTTKTIEPTDSPRQAAWLYYNVFKPKYGEAAIFSYHYNRIYKKYIGITYSIMGRRKKLTVPGAFWLEIESTGHKGIFIKKDNGDIQEVYGPSLGMMMAQNKSELERMTTETMAGLNKDIDARVGRYLKMMKSKI